MDSYTDTLATAMDHRDAGRYDDARIWLDRRLVDYPDDAEALALLTQIHVLRKDLPAAAQALEAAQAIDPARPAVLRSGARLLLAQGKAAEAFAAAHGAWQAEPDQAENLHVLAVNLAAGGRDGQALDLLDRAIAAHPTFAEALAQRALIRMRGGQPVAALADADAAFRLKPFLAHYAALAATLRDQTGDRAGAIEALRAAHAIDPGHAGYLVTLGEHLRRDGRVDEAIALLHQASRLAPDQAVAWANLGTALQHAGRVGEARDAYDRALAIDSSLSIVANNLGGLARDAADWEAALRHFERAIAARPDFAEAIVNRATALMNLGRLDEADAGYRAALSIQPDLAEARWSRGAFDLLRGDFEAGWQGYEWRWRMERIGTPRRAFAQPLWTGTEPIDGRTLLVHWEQGLGDSIQFCRYASLLAERGARVKFASQPVLRRLMTTLGPDVELVGLDDAGLDFDLHVPLLSVPHAFGTRAQTIPAMPSYLAAEPDRITHWRARIGSEGFRIGICWQGGPAVTAVSRSFPLALFAGIAAMPGVRLISLQKGGGEEQLANLPPGMAVESLGDGFDIGGDAFVDSAAVIAQCDLLISCDTAIGHLGGALGVPTWLALKHIPDWRWMLGRTDSPWYPSVRLFRQPGPGDWVGVFAAIETALRQRLEELA